MGSKENNLSIYIGAVAVIVGTLVYFASTLLAVSASRAEAWAFEVRPGEGFRHIVDRLKEEKLIRSSQSFKALSIVTGSASKLKPGLYKLSSSMTSYEILNELITGSRKEVVVTIPEGASMYEIDKILSGSGVTKKGDFISKSIAGNLEGRLFPDTYKFFTDSDAEQVVNKLLDNFKIRTEEVLGGRNEKETLILASLLEKEVPDPEEQKVVAGILKKRLEAGIPLQVDATICYIKVATSPSHEEDCYPLHPLDFKIGSPYNTYLHRGLPIGPIGNPGLLAIKAALNPEKSPYLFYLSDPKTKKTIFAKTLEGQIENKVRYLP